MTARHGAAPASQFDHAHGIVRHVEAEQADAKKVGYGYLFHGDMPPKEKAAAIRNPSPRAGPLYTDFTPALAAPCPYLALP